MSKAPYMTTPSRNSTPRRTATRRVPARDDRLVRLVRRFVANAASDGPVDQFHEARTAIGATPAATAAGLRAKAEAVRAGILLKVGVPAPADDEFLAWSLCGDLLCQ